MKRIILFIGALLLFAVAANAQTPESFKYQAVARGGGGQILASQSVSFRIGILKGSSSSASVYTETHAVNTNIFGLVNLAIGNGAVITGDFAAIDWGMDNYFVQIEMDANGGDNYQLMGTSQLLSVPYAIHARTAENVDDADADPTNELQSWSTLPGIPDDIADGDQVEDADADPMNEIELPPGGTDGQVLTLSGGVPVWADLPVPTPLQIGDTHAGGIIFYLDPDGVHGLVAAPSDQSGRIGWGCLGTDISGVPNVSVGPPGGPGADLGWGAVNTTEIVKECEVDGIPARLCDDLVLNGYNDWFLPSVAELNLIRTNLYLAGLGGFDADSAGYWSSSEINGNLAWAILFPTGSQREVQKIFSLKVRAVRAF